MRFDWKLLTQEAREIAVPRGSLLMLKDDSWRNEWVVLMLCEWVGDSDCDRSMVRISGSKSGINPFQLLPKSAIAIGESLTVGWLIENWNEWIWLESSLSSAKICYGPVSVDFFT